MTGDFQPHPLSSVNRGRVVRAVYREPETVDYAGNPLIEALPPVLTAEQAMRCLSHYPRYAETQCEAPDHVRYHLIQNAMRFFAPLDIHLDLERRFSWRRQPVLDRAWNCSQAETRREFSQRLRRWREWAPAELSGAVQEMTLKLQAQRTRYAAADADAAAHRTTHAVDRLMHFQDRWLYARRYLQGQDRTARLAVRAQTLLWNFHPYSLKLRRAAPDRQSPFADLNGFQDHENWLHNLLIAASLSEYTKVFARMLAEHPVNTG